MYEDGEHYVVNVDPGTNCTKYWIVNVDRVILHSTGSFSSHKSTDAATNESLDKIHIFNWSLGDELVAEGRLCSVEPKEMVNNIPLSPNAAVVMIEMVVQTYAYLWRPSSEMLMIGDARNERIAWPIDQIKLINAPPIRSSPNKSTTNSANNSNQSVSKQKCYLLDCNNSGCKVAEGRVWSTNPTDVIHFKQLGPNASKVWVDVPLVGDAKVWRPNSGIVTIQDALGSTLAWPNDKLIYI